ncbi:MAG: pyrroline-5-carboxylate reductase [bacterium]
MRIGFVGSGKMAEAMAAGMIAAGIAKPSEIMACDIDVGRLKAMKKRLGVGVSRRNSDAMASAATIFLAVKPYQMGAILEEIRPAVSDKHLIISIAAGVPIQFIEANLGRGRIVRVMPNMPCLVAAGMSVFAMGSRSRATDRRTVSRLLGSFGRVLELPESVFDSVTALSGSGPAFFAYLLDKLAGGAIRRGLDRKTALVLAAQTMLGTARILIEQGIDPRDLVASVTTPNGTTAAGLAVMEAHGTETIMDKAVKAAAKRCRELAPAPKRRR